MKINTVKKIMVHFLPTMVTRQKKYNKKSHLIHNKYQNLH